MTVVKEYRDYIIGFFGESGIRELDRLMMVY